MGCRHPDIAVTVAFVLSASLGNMDFTSEKQCEERDNYFRMSNDIFHLARKT